MSYHKKRPGKGLGVVSWGIDVARPPQQVPSGPTTPQSGQPATTPPPVPGGSSSAGPGAGDVISGFLKALTGGFGTSTMTPAQPIYYPPPSSGPSTTTIVAIGGVAILAAILLTRD